MSKPRSHLCLGTPATGPCSYSGPHPHWIHYDEVELMNSPFEVEIIPGTEDAVFRGPFRNPIHFDGVTDISLCDRPATKVGKYVIFSDGASRKLSWRERIAYRWGRLNEVPRGNAKIVLV